MKVAYSNLMSSQYFNPAFNSAIFDGPLRIYFAQFHESLALKLYFSLQQKHSDILAMAKDMQRLSGANQLVLLYPSSDAFQMSFEGCRDFIQSEILDDDYIVGVNGPFEDDKLELVLKAVVSSVEKAFAEHANLRAEEEKEGFELNGKSIDANLDL